MRRAIVLFIICVLFSKQQYGNPQDSLRNIIDNGTNDSLKVVAFTVLAFNQLPDAGKALEILNEMNSFCENKLQNPLLKALCYRKLGVVYGNLNYFDRALEYTFKSAEIFEKINNKEGLANCYNNIGSFYNSKGEFTKDILFYKRSIDYHLKAIQIRKDIKDENQLHNSYNNIGGAYISIGDYTTALVYFNMALEVYEKNKDANGLELVNTNLGNCYLKLGLKENNKVFLRKAQSYFLLILKNMNVGVANDRYPSALSSVGEIYIKTGNIPLGLTYLEKALEMAKKLNDRNGILDATKRLSEGYENAGNYAKALELMHFYNANKDSLINEKNSSQIEEIQVLYRSSQKDREIEKLNDEKAVTTVELSRQRTIIFSAVGAAFTIFIMVLVLLSRNNLKKKANAQLSNAYQKIEIKSKQITDSINYSKRIQTAILAPKEEVAKHLNNFFIFYSPKDIVSGDFYWFTEHNNRLFFIVVDCTGHGVPGALMSMIGNTLLNEIINQKSIVEPGEILNQLNKGVKRSLRQADAHATSQDDGMDVSVCCFDKTNPLVLHYATANHSVFVKSNNQVIELNGDIYSIGGDFANDEKSFESKSYTLSPNSFVIMSTDGFYDQFGGPKESKFLVSRFEELIMKIDFSTQNPEEEFKNSVEQWKGNGKQTDDILVAGFKV